MIDYREHHEHPSFVQPEPRYYSLLKKLSTYILGSIAIFGLAAILLYEPRENQKKLERTLNRLTEIQNYLAQGDSSKAAELYRNTRDEFGLPTRDVIGTTGTLWDSLRKEKIYLDDFIKKWDRKH